MTPRILTFISAALIAAAFTGAAQAKDFPKGSPKFLTDYGTAVAEAKKTGKPVLVVFSATWCPPCQANKKNVYPSAAVQPYHDKFVWAYLDTDVAKNANVAEKFSVRGIPHIQFLNNDGSSLDKSMGGTTPERFAKTLKKVLKKAAKKK
ncbi:MAG: thioredoxin-like negative regulator of GroEL [Verrucomicrobiales bacterium]|jgi:thioredoxin-like negative regulator of GroEL